jgi:hypothetical protein
MVRDMGLSRSGCRGVGRKRRPAGEACGAFHEINVGAGAPEMRVT